VYYYYFDDVHKFDINISKPWLHPHGSIVLHRTADGILSEAAVEVDGLGDAVRMDQNDQRRMFTCLNFESTSNFYVLQPA
jgi:hypothetical protein